MDRKEFEKVKDEYDALRGWDVETGAPTRETLRPWDSAIFH
jgi:aldehyde:ferredoxin oxidoreductase